MTYRKHGNVWQVRRHVRAIVKDKAEAIRLERLMDSAIALARRQHRENISGCCSISDKLEEFLEDLRIGLGSQPRGHGTLKRHACRLEAFDIAFQRKPLDAIGRERVERWIKRRMDQGVSGDTVNADLSSLRVFAHWAQDKKYAPEILPLLSTPRLKTAGKLPGLNRRPPPVREMNELKRLIKTIKRERPDIGLFLLGMGLFGRRPAAVAMWKRRHYLAPRAGDDGRLMTRGLKGGLNREIAVPKGDSRHKWVRKCLALGKKAGRDKPGDPLVPCLGKRSRKNPGGWTTESLDMALSRLLRRLKSGFTAYQVRHSCVSWLQLQEDITLGNTQGYADHAKVTTQEAYTHRHNRDAEAAYRIMATKLADIV